MSAATAGRGAGVAVSSSRASRRGDEDDDVLSVFIQSEGVWLVLGCGLGWTLGCLVGCVAGLLLGSFGWQGPGKSLSSPFLFSFYFCFEFWFYNSVLNSSILCRYFTI
jgi:hypothetical protein